MPRSSLFEARNSPDRPHQLPIAERASNDLLPGGERGHPLAERRSISWCISAGNAAGQLFAPTGPKCSRTAFKVSCSENCSGPETFSGRQAHYIAELSWGSEKQKNVAIANMGLAPCREIAPPDFQLPELKVLSLPGVFAARAMYSLRGMFLFQEFLTNRTASLPHIQTCRSTYE